ncbi:transposase [Bradyrhizobium sp. CCGUVB23]|uniref:transposase n=1 Tax=Bradyrhizobium sp. CCGUVB23 TaxID=2949630 RepID=UPI0020B1F01D|nr:transposase [Bradyrhizobium sp. CCGUVB23]MCP3468279.1 transposase [Bradyrhizobium sp. CCGUVB23]
MDVHKDSAVLSRIEVVETGRRRHWTRAEKLRIVEESLAGPRLVSATARRYRISRQLLLNWRKALASPHRAGEGSIGSTFVPAIVVPGTPYAYDEDRLIDACARGRRTL